jgi:diguanylate cyclase
MPRRGRLVGYVRTIGAWRVLCCALLAAYLLSAVLRRDPSYSLLIDGVLYTGVYLACALCCFMRASLARESATIWRAFAAGLLLSAFGWAAAAHWLTHLPIQPVPSVADIGWLGFYPLTLFALTRVMHQLRVDRSSVSTLLDAIVAGLGATAIAACVVLPSIAHSVNTTWQVTATDAAYPIGDVLLLGVVVAILLVARFDVPRAVWALLGGLIVLICGDSAYLANVANGGIGSRTLITATGATALVVVSLCAGSSFVSRPAAVGSSWLVQLIPAAAAASSLTILLVGANGRFRWIIAGLAAATLVASIVRLIVSFYEARALADSRQLAQTDDLTGLVNRRGFQEAAAKSLADGEGPLAVLIVDLDGFKDINDGLGHATGDDLLRALGARLAHETRAGTLIGRIGGDEFAVLTDDSDGAADAVAHRLLTTIRRPYELQGMELRVDASIGIASAPQHGTTLDDLLRHADIAMYRAKAAHKGALRYSSDAERTHGSLRTIGQLRQAIENDPSQLVLHYQPKVNLLSGAVCGVEALVRWQHPERGLLMPVHFLPLAEKARLMQPLTERVLERALTEMHGWKGELCGQAVAVNLSADAVSDPALVERVAHLLQVTNTPPQRLQLEITEDFLMTDLAGARVVLDKLRLLGIAISIDDYGTGYSSLAYLRDLPVDELKLDRAFVQPILGDRRAAAIVRSTIDLAHSLGLTMVAEGIEDADTWHRLLAMGCDVGQGYLFGRPQPARELEVALASPDSVLKSGGYGELFTQSSLRPSA